MLIIDLFLRLSVFRFHFATRIFVPVQTAHQGTDFFVAFYLLENDRRTGG